jgi:hypothetical protein
MGHPSWAQQFILDVWAHLAAQALLVVTEAAPLGQGKKLGVKTGVTAPIGIALGVFVEIPSLTISDSTDTFVWQGSLVNASFIVDVPSDTRLCTHTGRAIVSTYGINDCESLISVQRKPDRYCPREDLRSTNYRPTQAA